jgi:hypothetical protein
MRIFMLHSLRRLTLIALVGVLAACNTSASTTPTPLPDPNAILNKAAAEIRTAQSLKIKLQLTGAPSYVDPPSNRIAFLSADGAYQAPDKITASVTASILGVTGTVDVIAIGDDQWMQNQILTAGQFVKRVFAPGFNAAQLISSDQGIQSALKAFKNVKLIGIEDSFGSQVYHISGTASGNDIAALTVGLIRGSDVTADLYVTVDTGRAERVVLVQPDTKTDTLDPTKWDLEIYDYNAGDIKIAAPTVATPTVAAPVQTAPATAAQ